MTNSESTKSKVIDWLRFFCVVMVVLLHAVGSPSDGHDAIAYQNGVYDTFRILFSEGLCRVAVPVFFIISGYLFFVRLEEWDNAVWIQKLRKRAKTILVPYLLWNIIAICFSLIMLYPIFILEGGDAPDMAGWYQRIGGIRAFWDAAGGAPINYPLWFIRDLMVFVLLSPVIYLYVKKTAIVGLAVFYALYFLDFLPAIPGLSAEGLFFFILGAYFATRRIDFTALYKKIKIPALVFACPLVIAMVMTYGNQDDLWGYARRLFTLFGSASVIGIATSLFDRRRIKLNALLSNSSFFVYAAHGTIVLPIMQFLLGKALPVNQLGLTLCYFAAPLLTIVVLVLCYHYLCKWMPGTASVLTGGRGEK